MCVVLCPHMCVSVFIGVYVGDDTRWIGEVKCSLLPDASLSRSQSIGHIFRAGGFVD